MSQTNSDSDRTCTNISSIFVFLKRKHQCSLAYSSGVNVSQLKSVSWLFDSVVAVFFRGCLENFEIIIIIFSSFTLSERWRVSKSLRQKIVFRSVTNMESLSKQELISTITKQADQIKRYEGRLRGKCSKILISIQKNKTILDFHTYGTFYVCPFTRLCRIK